MENRLKPCPFCGGEAEVRYSELSWKFVVRCTECGAMGRQWFASKFGEEYAIDSWNNRAEHTCRIVPKPSDSDFVNDWHYLCSECGCEIPVYERDPNNYKVIISHANYCPTCGARAARLF